jgi:hypothetical protein
MTADTTGCEHQWEPTGIAVAVSGRKWQQGQECSYCPKCRNFARKTTMFLDGDLFKSQRDADRANHEANEVYQAEKQAWLREHYPEHIREETTP